MAAFVQYQKMRESNLIFSYCGLLNHELMASILQISDSKLRAIKANNRRKKNIINILIECLQNVIFHAGDNAGDKVTNNVCLVALGEQNGEYTIMAGNHLTESNAKALEAKLKSIINLDSETVHQLYLEQLSKGELSDKGGAGLGILRMMRESNKLMNYSFNKTDDNLLFFSLQIKVAA